MQISVQNFANYRLTIYSRQRPTLYNSATGRAWSLTEAELADIDAAEGFEDIVTTLGEIEHERLFLERHGTVA